MNLQPSGALGRPLPPLAAVEGAAEFELHEFEQRVDHFNFFHSTTFRQRYLLRDAAFRPGGPIFVFTGAEGGNVTRVAGDYGTPVAHAEALHGQVLFLECRFFGGSLPFGLPDSLEPVASRLGLLSIEQIIADYTAILSDFRQRCGAACAQSPIVTFGGSLAGTLAALMRLRAPWLVSAAWSSSSPLLGYVGMHPPIDPYAWRAQVTSNWASLGSEDCTDLVRSGFRALSAAAPDEISLAFNTCEAPYAGNAADVQSIVWGRLESDGEFCYPPKLSPIRASCDAMEASSGGLAIFSSLLAQASSDSALTRASDEPEAPTRGLSVPDAASCLNLTAARAIDRMPGAIAWQYLACTEVVHPIGSNNVSDFFPPSKWSVASLEPWCASSFDGVRPRPRWLPNEFGLYSVPPLRDSASRILFTCGLPALEPIT